MSKRCDDPDCLGCTAGERNRYLDSDYIDTVFCYCDDPGAAGKTCEDCWAEIMGREPTSERD